jgi:hypothetical protein
MHPTALIVSIFASLFVSLLVALSLIFLPQAKAAEEKAHARRLTEAKMNARLLRFNL